MPSLTKQDVGIINTALKKNAAKVRLTAQWQSLHDNYGIGRCEGGWLHLTRQDMKDCRLLVTVQVGIDPSEVRLSGNRTEVSRRVKNEKWSTTSVRRDRIYCSALNSPILLKQGQVDALPEVEFCIDYHDIVFAQYDGIMVIENLEAFIYCHSFCFPDIGKILIAYRGHDQSARALQACLKENAGERPVYYFCDPDPAGIGIVIDSPCATHAIVPAMTVLQKKNSLVERFAQQLAVRNDLREQCAPYADEFCDYANHVINEGIAISQEWLCSHNSPLTAISLR